MEYPGVHVYAQLVWHTPASIIGTREGIERLKGAVDAALEMAEGGAATAEVTTNDGEGYDLRVEVVDKETFDRLGVPYIDEIAKWGGPAT